MIPEASEALSDKLDARASLPLSAQASSMT
jgi:hypothetical protein